MGEVLGSTAISITWESPVAEGQNGVIISYRILLLEIPSNTTLTYQQDGSHRELVADSLHPYYDYMCSVAAETEVGTGPFSSSFVVRTLEDGMYRLIIVW